MKGFIELTSHAITIEFLDLNFCRAAASVEGGFLTSPVRYLIIHFLSMISLIDYDHSLKFFPFNFSIVNWKDELSIPLGPMLGMVFLSSRASDEADPLFVAPVSAMDAAA